MPFFVKWQYTIFVYVTSPCVPEIKEISGHLSIEKTQCDVETRGKH